MDSGYGIGFDTKGTFSFSTDGFDKNAIIFGVNMSSSVQVDNKEKYFLIIGEIPTQGLDDTKKTAENKYLIDYTMSRKKFWLRCHYDGETDIYFLMVQKWLNSKQKTLKLM